MCVTNLTLFLLQHGLTVFSSVGLQKFRTGTKILTRCVERGTVRIRSEFPQGKEYRCRGGSRAGRALRPSGKHPTRGHLREYGQRKLREDLERRYESHKSPQTRVNSRTTVSPPEPPVWTTRLSDSGYNRYPHQSVRTLPWQGRV